MMNKVLILTTSFPTKENPSAGRFILNLAIAFSKISDAMVLFPSAKDTQPIITSRENLKVLSFRYAPNRLEILAQRGGGIPAAMKANKYTSLLVPLFLAGYFVGIFRKVCQVDYVQANWIISGFLAAFPVVIFKKKMITTLHGEDVRKLKKSYLHRLMFRVSCISSKKIVCVGQDMLEMLTVDYPKLKDKLVLIPNGIDPKLLCLEKKEVQRASKKIILVSSLIDTKSVDHAILALAKIHSELPMVELNIVGDGPLKESLVALRNKHGLVHHINFLGAIDQEDVYEMYAQSDLFLICSRAEGRSSVVLEALAAGLPVIGANSDGVREILNDAPVAQLYDYGNVCQLAEKIRKMLRHDDLGMAINNRNYMKALAQTWDSTASQYIGLYSEAQSV